MSIRESDRPIALMSVKESEGERSHVSPTLFLC